MRRPVFGATLLLAVASPALAAPDLTTRIAAPAATPVYDTARYTVTVTNGGQHTANNVVVAIQLPETNTSPQVHVMGILGARSASCAQSGTTLNCAVGSLAKRKSASVWFDVAVPWSAAPVDFSATATTTTAESNTGNNGSSATASITYEVVAIAAPAPATATLCTGTGLTAFYECSLYPSSLSSYALTFEDGNALSIAGEPDYAGTWAVNGTELAFDLTWLGDVVASFQGDGVSPDCFEGLTTFPGSPGEVSPYEICLD